MYKLGIRVGVMAAAVALAAGCGGGKSDDKHNDGGISAQARDKAGSGSPGGYITPSERTGSQPPAGSGAVAHASGAAGVSGMTAAEHEFVSKTVTSSLSEVELGRLAMANGSNSSVKSLGNRIAVDHEGVHREVRAMMPAAHDGAAPTFTPPQEHVAVREQLAAMKGPDFDRAYVDEMVKHHQRSITEFEHAVQSMQDPVRSFAERTLPTLRVHLEMSQQLQKQVGQRGQ
jgi:putative membrane protein